MEGFSEKVGILALLVTTLSLGSSPHPIILIFSYLIHELGHLVFSSLAGAKLKKLKIGPLHLSISYDTSGLTYKREILVQLGGIAFNLFFALCALALPIKGNGAEFFIVSNFSLAAMNLYPVSILDGGGILKNVFSLFLSGGVAEKASRTVSLVCGILMWLVAVYLQIIFKSNLSLFIISVLLLVELCFSYS